MASKLSSAQRAEIVSRYQSGEGSTALGAAFDVTSATIRNTLKAVGIDRTGCPPVTDVQVGEMVRLYADGQNIHQIGKTLAVASSTVRYKLMEAKVVLRASVKRHKLTEDQKLEALEWYERGASYEVLAARYGVCQSTIGNELIPLGLKPRTGWALYRTTLWTDRRGRSFRFKSTWEGAYARYLDLQLATWDYEPTRYKLKVCRRYTPDFVVYGSGGELDHVVEVHGWLDDRVERKLVEFVSLYPQIRLELLGPAEMAALGLVAKKFRTCSAGRRITELRRHFRFSKKQG
jgi:hypothetical protein